MYEGPACNKNARVTFSEGAAPCVMAFVRGTAPDGSHTLASIHVSIENGEHAFDPIEANDQILRPLDAAIEAEAGASARKDYYLVGGNPSSIDSCVSLVYAAERRGLNIAACWLPANSEHTYVDAMLTKPHGNDVNGKFYVTQGRAD